MLEKVVRLSVRFRAIILISWVAIVLLCGFTSMDLNSRLTTSINVPKSGSESAESVLHKYFSEQSEGLITIMDNFGTLPLSEIDKRKSLTREAVTAVPQSKIVLQQALAGNLFTVISTNSTLQDASRFIGPLRTALMNQGLDKALVSGPSAIYHDVTPVMANDLRRGELIAIGFTLILLVLALGFSRAVFVPIFFAISVLSIVLVTVGLISHFLTMVLYVPNIVQLIGFGLSMDYSLLAVHRFREEQRNNPTDSLEGLIVKTMQSSGKTILISSTSVALALTTLLFFPIPFIQSLGAAVLLVPVSALFVAFTLLPALLYFFATSNNPAARFLGLLENGGHKSRNFAWLTNILLTKPKLVFMATLLTLLALSSPIAFLHVTPSSLTALPDSLESSRALTYLTSRAGEGIITPVVVIIDLKENQASADKSNSVARVSLAEQISGNSEVLSVAQGDLPPYVDQNGRFYRLVIIGRHEVGSPVMRNLVQELRTEYLPEAQFKGDYDFYVGGAPAQGVDLVNAIKKSAPLVFLGAILIIGLMLGKSFKSILIPIKAMILSCLSILVALGTLVVFISLGLGSKIFGTYQLPQIEIWVLLFLVVILFGISIDYEVFILSRIRESRLAGASNQTAVIHGFEQTIRVVSFAAAIFMGSVSGFIAGNFAGLQELGIGLIFAVLVDATLIRFLLLPSAMILLGRANWWYPNRRSRHLER